MPLSSKKILFVAPNIHTGGGLVLLKALLADPALASSGIFILDYRAKVELIPLVEGSDVLWVKKGVFARLKAELYARKREFDCDKTFCFHNLPTLLTKRKVNVFLQNRLLINDTSISRFSVITQIRIQLERYLLKKFLRHIENVYVQTNSMKKEFYVWLNARKQKHSYNLNAVVTPFIADETKSIEVTNDGNSKYDFVYVSDGQPHKNHMNLLEAWRILASWGIKPRLAITLSERDTLLKTELFKLINENELFIDDLGTITHQEVFELYNAAGALIFPSKLESFGLPLIEATRCGLPIVAPELDYVRDVCVPAQTFNPESAISIARAVERFLGYKNRRSEFIQTKQFINQYLL